ncbi:MAG: menaquinone biosynthesis protein [Bacteroidales bacterium]
MKYTGQRYTIMHNIRISAVKYANTYPFIWGLKESGFDRKAIIETDHPAQCASKLAGNRADIGLIPVAAIPGVAGSNIISDYCIGANGKVRTVMLLGNCPFEEVNTISLDYRSVSSVTLVRVLARHMWNKEYKWVSTNERTDFFNIPCNEAVVLIGDQCFESESKFSRRIDLAEEWKKYTGLPFVFACWVANKNLDERFLSEFNAALGLGVRNIDKVVEYFSDSGAIRNEVLKTYLTENIDFKLDEKKHQAMKLFLELIKKI